MDIPNRKKSAEMILEIIHTIQEKIEKQKNGSIEIPTGRITVLCIHIILTTFLQAIDKALPYIIAILAYKHF